MSDTDDDYLDDEDFCDECYGTGFVYEDEYECDWVNYGHRAIVCPQCNGDGSAWCY